MAHPQHPRGLRLPMSLGFPDPASSLVIEAYAERDGWICHLCRDTVYMIRGYGSLRPSCDHLIPRSRGGTHAPENIAIAHLGCNKGRRDRPIEEFKQPARVRDLLIVVRCREKAVPR